MKKLEPNMFVMLSGFLLDPKELSLDTILKHCQKKYKFCEDYLPSKLAKLVDQARETEKAATSETEDKQKKNVKREKLRDKNDKKEKSDKKDKKKKKKG